MSQEQEKKDTFEMDDLLANPFGSDSIEEKVIEEEKSDKLIDALPEEKRKRAIQLEKQIDQNKQQSVTQYGIEAQEKLMNFSHGMLDQVKNNDIGEIGSILSDLMKKLEQVDPEELDPNNRGFFARIFNRV